MKCAFRFFSSRFVSSAEGVRKMNAVSLLKCRWI